MDRDSSTWNRLDELGSRLASESMLAQPGSDEGLIPAYSLISEMADMTAELPTLHDPILLTRKVLDDLLNKASPFTVESIEAIRTFSMGWQQLLEAATDPDPGSPAVLTALGATSESELLLIDATGNHDLLQEFHAEAMDHLQQVEAALLDLEQNPGNDESINSVFRSFHTIKGIAGFLQLDPVHHLSHEVESVLDLARRHELELTPRLISLILQCRDSIKSMCDQVGMALMNNKNIQYPITLCHLLNDLKLYSPDKATAQPQQGAPTTEPATNATPLPQSPVEAETTKPAVDLNAVRQAVAAQFGNITTTGTPTAVQSVSNTPQASGTDSSQSSANNTTVRVNTEKLDSLMDVVGELVIIQSQLQENTRSTNVTNGETFLRALTQLSRITKDLQYTSMGLRMMPMKSTFQKMERLARDTARVCNKQITYQAHGESTELDRTMVELIHDPLVHLVRNSIDHGIESPADRKKAGKPEKGLIKINAYHHGGSILIEISDDGNGISPDAILKKAREQGLVTKTDGMTKEEILRLLFMPGFTTAKAVTSISGRGVGLDVVRKNIDRLRGVIDIESQVGVGTTFRIKLPLTMAIIDGLVVKVGTARFILPTNSVIMTTRPTQNNCHTVLGRGEIVNIRGQTLPLFRLHRAFGIEDAVQNPWDGLVAVIESAGRSAALLVDEILNKQEVVIKNLGPLLQSLHGISGGTIMGDGSVALILDPSAFIKKATN
ncbi:MAG: chemotaxis protein CheA [Verrucomicrobiota bacterium]|nr:chemotaxis protein CheA [Verrucomicrobiota bacterium]